MSTAEHFVTSPRIRRGRGRAQKSVDLIQTAYDFLEEANPTTVRGVAGLAAAVEEKLERQGEFVIWWDEQTKPDVATRYGRNGTVTPETLDKLGLDRMTVHRWRTVYDSAEDYDGRDLIVLYVGDWDPSGLYMSEADLPARLARYGGDHVTVIRIALLEFDLAGLPSFPASDKRKDPRYRWFSERYGSRCWELDAMHPNDLRERVRESIVAEILDPDAWARCEIAQEAEQESLRSLLDGWRAP